MSRLENHEIRALTRVLALFIAEGSTARAENVLKWAYSENNIQNASDDFIKKFLYNDKKVPSNLKKEFIQRFIKNDEQFPVEAVKSIILHMPYPDFLETPYWKAISDYVKSRDFHRCTKCGNQNRLQVHHMTYAHHGDELHNLRELTTLCRNCHKETTHEATRVHKTSQDD